MTLPGYIWESLLSKMTIPELVEFGVCPLEHQEELEIKLAQKHGLIE